jgi:hypothetical protein
MTRSCRTKFERGNRYIKVLVRLEFGKASMGLQTNDGKQTMSSSFDHSPTRTADGLTAVSQRPNVDPSSEYTSRFTLPQVFEVSQVVPVLLAAAAMS